MSPRRTRWSSWVAAMAGSESATNREREHERWLASLPIWLHLLCQKKQHFFLKTAWTFTKQLPIGMLAWLRPLHRLSCWYNHSLPRTAVRTRELLPAAFSFQDLQSVALASKEKVNSKTLHLRLFRLERFVTRRAVQSLIKLHAISLVTVLTCRKEVAVRSLFH